MTFEPTTDSNDAFEFLKQQESAFLAPYAMHTAQSRGRRYPESAHRYRTAYVRDRDRIVHSSAFRRLMHKTQVFIAQPLDHQRARLTHTLEVVQIARTVARNLRLNEDLTEAIALAHDLGHPPFGHAGERILNHLMKDHGGFDHNSHGLRLLEVVETRYPAFPGLNLSYEILESIALRCKNKKKPELAEFSPELRMLAEAQTVDAADSIAYVTHDIDDALRCGMIGFEQLRTQELWRIAEANAMEFYGPKLEGKQLARAVIRCLIELQVSALLKESQSRLAKVHSVQAVKESQRQVISLDDDLARKKSDMEKFLFQNVYRHPEVVKCIIRAERLLRRVFEKLVREPMLLSARFRERIGSEATERIVCDYMAGMTDRFAIRIDKRHRGKIN